MSPLFLCTTGHCECPPVPVNGLITNCHGAPRVGTVISYHCIGGYIMEGNGSRVCHPGGNWTGIDPICLGQFVVLK